MRHSASSIVLLAGLCLASPHALARSGDGAAPVSAAKGRVLDSQAARAIGFAPGWQSQLPVLAGTEVQGLRLIPSPDGKGEHDALYAWDRSGAIMRLDPGTGDLRWNSASVLSRGSSGLIDVFTAPVGKSFATVGFGDVNCLTLDARTGVELGLNPYGRIPITPSVRSGSEFVYASRAGQLVWVTFREEAIPSIKERRPGDPVSRNPEVAAMHVIPIEVYAHALKGSIVAPPVRSGDRLVACSTMGDVACFAPGTKRLMWQLHLPGGIVASPAATDTQVFVPCRDQYLRCINLHPTTRGISEGGVWKQKKLQAGSVAWKWFTETPLERPPFASGDRVVIQVPGQGLVALDASPSNQSLTRQPLWVSKASGDGLTRTQDGLVTWDAATRTLSLVEMQTGAVRDTRTLPEVVSMQATAVTNGDLLMMTSDGRVQRCPPLNPLPAAAPAEPAPAEKAAEPKANADAEPAAEPASSGT